MTGDCFSPTVTLALRQTAACQVIHDSNCPDDNKRVAEVEVEEPEEREAEEEAKQTEGGGEKLSLLQQNCIL